MQLYPAAWRARYGVEFEALLAERPPSRRDAFDIVLGAIDARLSPQVESPPVARHAPIADRLAGAAAIAGGLLWSGTYFGGWLLQAEGDLSFPILLAVGFMLLSLPGTYLAAYARPVVLGVTALGVSVAALLVQLIPWSPLLLLPVLAILGVLGPGALALAAARAGVSARGRWQLLFLTIPWPFIGGFVALTGLVSTTVPMAAVIASFLPLGIAWMVLGLRIARGRPTVTTATTGGAA
jgi:hypothetical protein